MSTWWGRCPPGNTCHGGIFGQMLSTILSWEVIFGPSLCVDWWCTSRETAERPLQARSSRAAMNTCPDALTCSSVTWCRSCHVSWVNWSLVHPQALPAYLSVTWLLGISSLFVLDGLFFTGKCNDTSWMCSFKISTCPICYHKYFVSVTWLRQWVG